VKIAITFSEPPPVTAWCAIVAAVADVYPEAVLIEPILVGGHRLVGAVAASPDVLITTIETGAMRAAPVFEGPQGCDLLHGDEAAKP
jgi:hypothetical protein